MRCDLTCGPCLHHARMQGCSCAVWDAVRCTAALRMACMHAVACVLLWSPLKQAQRKFSVRVIRVKACLSSFELQSFNISNSLVKRPPLFRTAANNIGKPPPAAASGKAAAHTQEAEPASSSATASASATDSYSLGHVQYVQYSLASQAQRVACACAARQLLAGQLELMRSALGAPWREDDQRRDACHAARIACKPGHSPHAPCRPHDSPCMERESIWDCDPEACCPALRRLG